ncbi:MAG: TVP38/TMEM64 family protein [Bacilli bacterium]|nr:TVP38/TMEM64 family protein [Bacilli bacterium]
MQDIIQDVILKLQDFVLNNNMFLSLFVGVFIIVLESIVPILPLALFIALNMIVFGNLFGFIISWIATIIGCSLSFFIFRKGVSKWLYKNIDNKPKTKKLMNIVSNISFSKLVIIMAIPFTPAFSINIGAGLSKMSYKKFLLAALIAKISIVYFWGFIGTTFVESITDVTVLVKLFILLIVAFILSKIVINKFDVD